jgi:hypothetical protein
MMKSEGPYKELSETCIEGPGFEKLPQKVFKDIDMAALLNLAFADGRKSAEKDFKELLEIANGMRSWCDVKEGWAMIWGMQFDAWKKARGIE